MRRAARRPGVGGCEMCYKYLAEVPAAALVECLEGPLWLAPIREGR